jgi:hypothetical protein
MKSKPRTHEACDAHVEVGTWEWAFWLAARTDGWMDGLHLHITTSWWT